MYTTLLTALENNILTVTINRPDKLNAISAAVMEELRLVVLEIQSNAAIKSAIITGAGAKAFAAGADISEFNGSQNNGKQLSEKGQNVFFSIEHSVKPIIAAVNGYALGAGCELAMSCHFRIASENAKFGQPEVNLGLLPGYGGTQRLAHLIGRGRALELLLTANPVDAATALRFGLANEVTPPERLLQRCIEILTLINTKAPIAVAGCIAAVNVAVGGDPAGYKLEAGLFGECFATEDMKEGKAAFLEKRKAAFSGK